MATAPDAESALNPHMRGSAHTQRAVDAIAEARALFSPEGAYLDSATYGLPPRPAWEALQLCADEWRHGRTGFVGWDRSVGAARDAFARLHGVPSSRVAVGSQVSPFVGVIAASLPAGSRVLAPQEDFTSLLFPFLAQQERGVRTDLVPLDRLAETIDGATDVVAFSAVQSACGRVADLDAVERAARHHGARIVVDATQASGWLPLDASRYDALISGGYKWLLNPRGTAFMAVGEELAESLVPHAAGWYANAEPMASLYGGPLRLAADAGRFDQSPAWLSWVGAAPALHVLEQVGIAAIHAHDVALANRLRAGLDLEPSDSAIVSVTVDAGAGERLAAAGVRASGRDGRLRFAPHLYSTEADVDRALEALAG